MSTTRFEVREVFDLPTRGGVIASGRLLAGSIQPGMSLRDPATGAEARVLGVELLRPPASEPDRVAIVIDRQTSSVVVAGKILVSPG